MRLYEYNKHICVRKRQWRKKYVDIARYIKIKRIFMSTSDY